MKIICISASNTRLGEESTSTKVCIMIKEYIKQSIREDVTVEVIPLAEYDIKPCILCGACYKSGDCSYDDDFNKLFASLANVDGLFLVVPHYSPLPSKLMILFEKLNEIFYASWINNPEYQSSLSNKPIGIIGHGGMVENEECLNYYHDNLITPIANTLKSLSFQVIKYSDKFPNGAAFGLKEDACLKKTEKAIFPDIIQDWPVIEERITPLVKNVLASINCVRNSDTTL